MKLVLLTFLFYIGAIYADEQNCVEQVKSKAVYTENTNDPSKAFKQEKAIRACEIEYAKKLLLSEDFRTLCPGVQTPYRQRCLREWISHYKISFAGEPSLLMNLVPLAGNEDQKIPHIHNQVLLTQLIDAALVAFERVEVNNFYVNLLRSDYPDFKDQIEILKKQELETLAKSQEKVLAMLEKKLIQIHGRSIREPASDNPTRQWVRTMVGKFKNRIQVLKSR